jgi:hypothetical protein
MDDDGGRVSDPCFTEAFVFVWDVNTGSRKKDAQYQDQFCPYRMSTKLPSLHGHPIACQTQHVR